MTQITSFVVKVVYASLFWRSDMIVTKTEGAYPQRVSTEIIIGIKFN